jgi:Zn finger protein HypA/HybF involved in hydrogenase expression
VNNPFNWAVFAVWVAIIAAIAIFALVTYKTRWYTRFQRRGERETEELKAQKVATADAKVMKLPIIVDEMVNEEVESREGFTQECSKCKQEFHTDKFEYICPACLTDTLYIKTKCIYCGTEARLDEPRNAYCKKCGSRLLRQPEKVLAQLRVALVTPTALAPEPEPEARETSFPVITDDMVDEEEEAREIFTLKCKKCGKTYESPAFQWTCPSCDGDTLFLRSKCLHCDKEVLLDSPRKQYCEKCKSRLLRQPERWAAAHLNANTQDTDT